jgi:hypothetical protein
MNTLKGLKGVLLMAKKIDALAMLKRMRETAQTGLQSGTWFATIGDNVGVELFGTVSRIFEYEYGDEKRLAFELRLEADTAFEVIIDEKTTEHVEPKAGELVLVSLSGQLRHLFEKYNVMPGTVAYLKYEGKDETKKIRGNHPHNWTYSFVDPSTGEASN